MGAFEDKLMDAGLPQGGVTPDEQYKQAVMPIAPMNTNPLPVIGPPTAEQVAAQQAVENQIYGWMPKISRYAGVQLPASSLPPSPKPMGGPVAPKAKPEPGEEDTWQYRFMGRPPTKEELAADKAEADAQAAVAAAEAKKAAIKAKYFRPELAQVPQDEFDKNQQLMRNLASIQQDKANIEATKLQNESMMVQQQADMLQRNAAEAQERDKAFFNEVSTKQREIDKKVQEVGDFKYNPRQVISNAGTLEKIGMIAGAMLGGWQQAMTKSGENQFLKAMDKIVQDEADRQEHEFGQKRYMANEAVNSYQRLMQDYKDRDTVRSVRESQIYKAMQTQIMSQALASGSATAVKNAEEANAAMDLRIQQNEMARWQSMYYNPDLVRGGGSGTAALREAKEGAKWLAEKEAQQNIPENLATLEDVLKEYKEGGAGWKVSAMGRKAYESSPTAYSLLPGVTQKDIAVNQKLYSILGPTMKEIYGASTPEEKQMHINTILGDRSPKSVYTGLNMIKNQLQAKQKSLHGGVSKEAVQLKQMQSAGELPSFGTGDMPDSTKEAGK